MSILSRYPAPLILSVTFSLIVLPSCRNGLAPEGLRASIQCSSCYGVSVTPDGTFLTRPPNTSGLSELFTVVNTGEVTTTYSISCAGTRTISCTGVSSTSVTIPAGQDESVTAYYSTGASAPPAKLILVASGGATDTGYYKITVQ